MHLFFTQAGAVWADSLDVEAEAADRFMREETRVEMPFLISASGEYQTHVNNWLRSLPTSRIPSKHSWKAYARDVKEWGTFLEKQGLTFWNATEEDLDRYHRLKRGDDPSISSQTWVRLTYALERLYVWAVEEDILKVMPFDPTRAREKGGRVPSIQFVSQQDYRIFRDVGLRGLLPDGSPDERSRLANVERNVLFADLLVTTGLRIAEAANVLLTELPIPSDDPRVIRQRWRVPAGVAKGGKERHTLVPVRVVRALHDYAQFERAIDVKAARTAGLYDDPGWTRLEHVTVNVGRRVGTGRLVKTHLADAAKRSQLLRVTDGEAEPLMLFLAEDGLPLSQRAWESIFERACERCARFGYDIHITPHVLRHTFATWTLARYLREHLQQNMSDGDSYKAYLLAPVRRLMRLLGHASALTTFEYLDFVGDVPELLDEVLAGTEIYELPELADGSALAALLANDKEEPSL